MVEDRDGGNGGNGTSGSASNVIDFPAGDRPDFRVPAADTQGHSERVWFRCQPGHAQAVSAIIQSQRWPYRTKGDLLRHALSRHLKYLASAADLPIKSLLLRVDAIMDLLRDEEMNHEFMGVFETLGTRVACHLGNGGEGEARRLIAGIQRQVDSMPDGYWRDKYARELQTRYGHLLEQAPKAQLMSMFMGDD